MIAHTVAQIMGIALAFDDVGNVCPVCGEIVGAMDSTFPFLEKVLDNVALESKSFAHLVVDVE